MHRTLRTQVIIFADASNSASATSEGKIPHKYWRTEFIPPENTLVYDAAILDLQTQVFTGQSWPSAAVMENMVERAWH